MKGISAVIATILLLLIVVAIVGFAFGFFQRIFSTTAAAVENQTESTLSQIGQSVRIDAVAGTAVTVRNVGSVTIQGSTLAFYVNGVARTCPIAGSVAPGAVASCTLSASCGTGSTLRVTTLGGEDSRSCP